MTFQQIIERLREIDAPGILEICEATEIKRPDDPAEAKKFKFPKDARTGDSYVLIEAAKVAEFARILRDDPELHFEILVDLTAVDPSGEADQLWVVYQFLSVTRRRRLSVKTLIPKAGPDIATLCKVYPAADWLEREAGEMFGINFIGHPDPRNMLLPEDWVGYPLRKDYEYPKEYHGISCI